MLDRATGCEPLVVADAARARAADADPGDAGPGRADRRADLAELIAETASRMPRDATVLAILPSVTPEAACALGNLRRQGRAVTRDLDTYEDYEFEEAAGWLAAEGIEARQLRSREALPNVCRDYRAWLRNSDASSGQDDWPTTWPSPSAPC